MKQEDNYRIAFSVFHTVFGLWGVLAALCVAGCLTTGCQSGGSNPEGSASPDTTASTASSSLVRTQLDWDYRARLVAGLADSIKASAADTEAQSQYQAFARRFDLAWKKKTHDLLNPLTDWSAVQLADVRAQRHHPTVFYPFSGPDFMTVQSIFPTASTYVLTALEPEGYLADPGRLSPAQIIQSLDVFQTSLGEVMQFSFYRTLDMEKELIQGEFRGALPAILAGMVRTGYRIQDVIPMKLTERGAELLAGPDPIQDPNDAEVTGYRIEAIAPDKPQRTVRVEYWSANIRNNYWTNKPAFTSYLEGLEPTVTYLKSASYLLHKEHFSRMRDLILSVSQTIVQDDSGVPYVFLKKDFDLALYGVFTGTIPNKEFAPHQQPDLQKAYRQADTVGVLPFGIGYKYLVGTSNLQIARKKKG
jgi:hypothetical protein